MTENFQSAIRFDDGELKLLVRGADGQVFDLLEAPRDFAAFQSKSRAIADGLGADGALVRKIGRAIQRGEREKLACLLAGEDAAENILTVQIISKWLSAARAERSQTAGLEERGMVTIRQIADETGRNGFTIRARFKQAVLRGHMKDGTDYSKYGGIILVDHLVGLTIARAKLSPGRKRKSI